MKSLSLILVAILAVSTNVEARQKKFTAADRANATNAGLNQANQISGNAQSSTSTTSTNYDTLQQSSQNTMNNSQKGQTTATVMKVGMYGLGTYYASQCSCLGNCAACVQAAVMYYMGSQAARSASSFQNPISGAWDNVCTYSTLGCNGTPENPYTAELTPGVINQPQTDSNLKKISEALKKGGFEVDVNSGKISGPSGQYNANDPSSLSSILGEDGVNNLMNKVKDIEKDAKAKVDQVKQGAVTAALGLEGGGGGIGMPAEAGYESDDGSGMGAGGGLAGKLDKLRDPAGQAKGLTKNFNGDPIGVAADSIFEMMNRRYQLKNNQKTFLGMDVK